MKILKKPKKKAILIIGLVLLIGIIAFAFAGDLLVKPTPKYNILTSFELDGETKMICFKVDGYEGTDPCFNSTEFVSLSDTQSLINFHNKMSEIDKAITYNTESINLNGKTCALDIQCLSVKNKEFKCIDFKCQVYDEDKDWADSLTSVQDVKI